MSTRNDGGRAFPSEQSQDQQGYWNETIERGMSLRDYFAGKALPAIIALQSDAGLDGEVKDAYTYADKMIEEGEKQ